MDKQNLLRTLGWTIVAILLGTGAGIGVGRATQPQPARPAALTAALAGVEAAAEPGTVAPLFADQTAVVAQVGAAGAATPAPTKPVAAGAVSAPAVPAVDMAAPPPEDILVLPHGTGRYVSLMLQDPGPVSAPVLRGTLTRDGPVNLATILRNPTIRTLRGPVATVELLHVGYDREARPVVGHIRLPDGPDTEGLVVLRMPRKGLPDLQIRVVPVPSSAEAKPAPETDL